MTIEPGPDRADATAAETVVVAPDPRRRLGVGAVIVLVLVAFAVTVAIGMVRGATGAETVSAGPTASALASAPVEAGLYVHVAGAVRRAGLYRLEVGDRVADAIALAGGFADDAARDGVNLARPVADGEQIVGPVVGSAPSGAPVGGGGRTRGRADRSEHGHEGAARHAAPGGTGDGRPHHRLEG